MCSPSSRDPPAGLGSRTIDPAQPPAPPGPSRGERREPSSHTRAAQPRLHSPVARCRYARRLRSWLHAPVADLGASPSPERQAFCTLFFCRFWFSSCFLPRGNCQSLWAQPGPAAPTGGGPGTHQHHPCRLLTSEKEAPHGCLHADALPMLKETVQTPRGAWGQRGFWT